jgi:hypothetical protein
VPGSYGGSGQAIRGPGGGAAGGVRGPGGGAAGGIRGPGGGAIGGIRGGQGGAIGGVRGPHGGAIYGHLPSGAHEVHWHGNSYWNFGFGYYQPCWYGGEVYYYSVPAPVGVYMDTLPPEADTVVYNNQTYYFSDGSYLAPKDDGYEVVDKPAGLDQAPDPMALLRQMTDCLGQMQRFSVVADETTDEILESGEKVQLSSRRTVYVRRPDALAIDYRSDKGSRSMLFDEGKVTIVDRAKMVYGLVDVPDSIDGMEDVMAQRYGYSILLGDLMRSDAYATLSSAVINAEYVGKTTLDGGQECDQLAFTQDNVDWQVWIVAGDKPLPVKLAVIYKSVQGSPRYVAELSGWTTDVPDSAFVIDVPKDAQKIDMLPIGAADQPATPGAQGAGPVQQ